MTMSHADTVLRRPISAVVRRGHAVVRALRGYALLVALLAVPLAARAEAPVPAPGAPPAAAAPPPQTGLAPAAASATASDPAAGTAGSTSAAPDDAPHPTQPSVLGTTPLPEGPPPGPEALAWFDWLGGCWKGSVNQRDFREHWLPPAGGMMIGAGQTLRDGKTQDYEFLRIEARSDGVYYVTATAGAAEATFRLAGRSHDELSNADIYVFNNLASGYPQRVIYRRGGEGWLYAGIEGTLNGEARKVLYPMRHVGCESGEFLRK
jgi:hypothetical protein